MKKWFLSFVLVLMVAISGLGVNFKSVYANEPAQNQLNIVALGDSITKGTGLTDVQNSFINKIALAKNASLTNLAEDGYKAEDVLEVIALSTNLEVIQNANTFCITVGGNHVLQPLLKVIKTKLNGNFSSASVIDIALAINNIYNSQTDMDAIATEIETEISNFNTNFPQILQQLRQKNSDAQIIVQTVYNPLDKSSADMISGIPAIFVGTINNVLQGLTAFIENYIVDVNETINKSQYKTEYSYQVFDTYTEFKEYNGSELLTNIASFDIHPNALGHEVIYNGMVTTIKDVETVPVNSTTIKIYTNGVYVNNPQAEVDPENPVEQVAGGEVADLKKDDNGYDIFEVEIEGTKNLVITEKEGYKLADVKLGETSQGAKKSIKLNGNNLPNEISIYFLEEFEVTFSTGYYGYLMVNSVKLDNPTSSIVEQVLFGSSISCSFMADYGYKIENVKIDGEQIDNFVGSNYIFENITSNHSFEVNFSKIETTTYTDPTYNIKLEASTESLPYGSVLNIYALTAGNAYNEILNMLDPYSTQMIIYDFSIKKGNLTISPNGSFTISIPVSTKYDISKTKLYYVSSENVADELTYSFDEETRMLTFTTDHCSYYALIQEGEPPKNLWWIWLIVGGALLILTAVIIVIVVKKKKDKKAKLEFEAKYKNDYFSY